MVVGPITRNLANKFQPSLATSRPALRLKFFVLVAVARHCAVRVLAIHIFIAIRTPERQMHLFIQVHHVWGGQAWEDVTSR